ncbi:MAG: DUF721 domain-containing protein [Bacteroidales bacterium]|nr:DUF721 domain-containing protein [Bacteroidales bacterium]
MKKTEARRVGDIISDIIDSGGSQPEFDRQKACYLWSELLGHDINRATVRRYIDGDVMHVYMTSAALKSELSFMTDALVARINDAVGTPVIKKIVLH